MHNAQPPKWITLDMDSSVSPTHGDQEGTAWNATLDANAITCWFLFKKQLPVGQRYDRLQRQAQRGRPTGRRGDSARNSFIQFAHGGFCKGGEQIGAAGEMTVERRAP